MKRSVAAFLVFSHGWGAEEGPAEPEHSERKPGPWKARMS